MSSRINSYEAWRTTTDTTDHTCAMGDGNIEAGEAHYESSALRLRAHINCLDNTPAARESRLLDRVTPMSDPEVYFTYAGEPSPPTTPRDRSSKTTRQNRSDEGQPQGFWARNKGKIILGAALVAGVAILGTKVLNAYNENWHQYCLHSLENAKDLWCCTKQVTADASTCLFKRLEPGNFWTDAGDLERLSLEELPKHSAEAFIYNTWEVTGAQKLFKNIFG